GRGFEVVCVPRCIRFHRPIGGPAPFCRRHLPVAERYRRADVAERLELRDLPEALAAAAKYGVLESVRLRAAETYADLLGAIRVEHVERHRARHLALDTRVDVEVVV